MIKYFRNKSEYNTLLNNLRHRTDEKRVANLLNSVTFIDGDEGGIYFQDKKYDSSAASSSSNGNGPVIIDENVLVENDVMTYSISDTNMIYQSAGPDLGSTGSILWGTRNWMSMHIDEFKQLCGVDYSTEDRQEYLDMFVESVTNNGVKLHLVTPLKATTGEDIEHWVNADMTRVEPSIICLSYHTFTTNYGAGPHLPTSNLEDPIIYDMYGMIYLDFDQLKVYVLHRIANRPFIMPPTFVSQEDFDDLQDEVANIIDSL